LKGEKKREEECQHNGEGGRHSEEGSEKGCGGRERRNKNKYQMVGTGHGIRKEANSVVWLREQCW
jgi:hypothetical protein